MSTCGADTEANDLMTSLLNGEDFTIPSVDLDSDLYKVPLDSASALYSKLKPLTAADFTEKDVNGAGFFDVIMAGAGAQLRFEYQNNRITGAEYTKAFISIIEAAMQTAVSLLTTKDQIFYQAQQAQIAAITALVGLETSKVQYAAMQMEAKTSKSNYALSKLKLTTEEMNYCIAKYNLANMLPAQLAQVQGQTALTASQKAISDYQLSDMLPTEKSQTIAQTGLITSQKSVQDYQVSSVLPAEVDQTKAQTGLISSQKSVEDYQLSDILPAAKAQTLAQTDLVESQKAVQDYQLSDILPTEKAQTIAQTGLVTSQKNAEDYNVSDMLPAQKAQVAAQTDFIGSQKTGQDYQNSDILPAQKDHEVAETALLTAQKTAQDFQNSTLLPDQHNLLVEQMKVQHAQISNLNPDGSAIDGIIGSQRTLYGQQVDSYKRDAEVKAAKLWMDGWSVMRTTDEGLNPPGNMSNDNINSVLQTISRNNGFG